MTKISFDEYKIGKYRALRFYDIFRRKIISIHLNQVMSTYTISSAYSIIKAQIKKKSFTDRNTTFCTHE